MKLTEQFVQPAPFLRVSISPPALGLDHLQILGIGGFTQLLLSIPEMMQKHALGGSQSQLLRILLHVLCHQYLCIFFEESRLPKMYMDLF